MQSHRVQRHLSPRAVGATTIASCAASKRSSTIIAASALGRLGWGARRANATTTICEPDCVPFVVPAPPFSQGPLVRYSRRCCSAPPPPVAPGTRWGAAGASHARTAHAARQPQRAVHVRPRRRARHRRGAQRATTPCKPKPTSKSKPSLRRRRSGRGRRGRSCRRRLWRQCDV